MAAGNARTREYLPRVNGFMKCLKKYSIQDGTNPQSKGSRYPSHETRGGLVGATFAESFTGVLGSRRQRVFQALPGTEGRCCDRPERCTSCLPEIPGFLPFPSYPHTRQVREEWVCAVACFPDHGRLRGGNHVPEMQREFPAF